MSRKREQNIEIVRASLTELNSLLQVPQLITPLREDAYRILNERHDDQETSNRRQVRLQGLRVNFHVVFHLFPELANSFEGVIWVSGAVSRR